MFLYKCIPFSKSYWNYILREETIRFSSIPELWQSNDKEEFDHRWESTSQFFSIVSGDFRPSYESLFSSTVILSLSLSGNSRCWQEFCPEGGVRYEFEFDESILKKTDINFNKVTYDKSKLFNLFEYIKRFESNLKINKLLEKQKGLNYEELSILKSWAVNGNLANTIVNHITQEIAFKKLKSFEFEDEFRLVYLTKQIGPKPLKFNLIDQKLPYSNIGLKLKKISTSDFQKVKSEVGQQNIEVCSI